MSVQDGLIFKGESVIIPSAMQPEMKATFHSSRAGIEGHMRRARECLFWLCMSGDIKNFISICETCHTHMYEISKPKETPVSLEPLSHQWEKTGMDLFKHDGRDYLVTAAYFSNYWETNRLENTKSSTVI